MPQIDSDLEFDWIFNSEEVEAYANKIDRK